MRENLVVFDFSLTDEEIERFKRLDKQQGVNGLRYDAPKMIELLQSY